MSGVLLIAGPTASGKSALALELASRLGGEIINADSQQVYRGLDIGTGKPTRAERERIAHHLYDIADPGEQLDAAKFVALADAAIADVRARGRMALVVGGTGLWLRALRRGLVDAPPRHPEIRARLEREASEQGLAALHERLSKVDPESASRIQPGDPVRIIRALEVFEQGGVPLSELHRRHAALRPRLEAKLIALDLPMPALEQRIARRVRGMFDDGLVEEARAVAQDPAARDRLRRVMGYREALEVLEGRMGLGTAIEAVVRTQRQYAKRQRTWFRAEPDWTWLPVDEAAERAAALLSA